MSRSINPSPSKDEPNESAASPIQTSTTPAEQPEVPPNTNKLKKRRRRNTSVACVNCSKWHVSCDSNRPCKRCVSKGLKDTCVDAPRKRSKYLAGVPINVLPASLRSESSLSPSPPNERVTNVNGYTTTNEQCRSFNTHENQLFSNPNHIIHKSNFLSNAANSEYSMLSNIIHQDRFINRIPVDVLYSEQTGRNNGESITSSTTNTLPNSRAASNHPSPSRSDSGLISPNYYSNHNSNSNTPQVANVPPQPYPSSYQNIYSILLGPHSNQILNSQVNLFANHFPLVPVESQDDSLSFKRFIPQDPSFKNGDLQKNKKINQYYLNNETLMFPEIELTKSDVESENSKKRISFALECSSPDVIRPRSNAEWDHSLRYSTPMEIYTLINEPFSHTPGFHHLLMYLRGRFDQKDVVEMCRSMAEFRPIFIACSVTLTEEDMIFMEQCYQRTLLEYSKFIEQIGTPTCVWRRNGQISYVNEEFEILTGWKREELLNKMTFIVEILDDDSVRDYFKTFSSVAYKDFKGTEQMKTCKILSPIKGKTIDCCCMWTLKRDISGLPLMILGNFMPVLSQSSGA